MTVFSSLQCWLVSRSQQSHNSNSGIDHVKVCFWAKLKPDYTSRSCLRFQQAVLQKMRFPKHHALHYFVPRMESVLLLPRWLLFLSFIHQMINGYLYRIWSYSVFFVCAIIITDLAELWKFSSFSSSRIMRKIVRYVFIYVVHMNHLAQWEIQSNHCLLVLRICNRIFPELSLLWGGIYCGLIFSPCILLWNQPWMIYSFLGLWFIYVHLELVVTEKDFQFDYVPFFPFIIMGFVLWKFLRPSFFVNWSCSICLDNTSDPIVGLPCFHFFHDHCFNNVIGSACPLCRAPFLRTHWLFSIFKCVEYANCSSNLVKSH